VDAQPGQTAWRIELARAHFEAGRPAEAGAELLALQRQGLVHLRSYESLAAHFTDLAAAGEPRRAWLFFHHNLRRRPDDIVLLNNAAWLLATTETPPAPPAEAVRLARRAAELAPAPHPGILDTLAAAFAASGQFELAIQTAQQAIELARAARDPAAAAIQQRLDAYRRDRPWRE
jgi:tetratricopeptide (TPR) repeat protein